MIQGMDSKSINHAVVMRQILDGFLSLSVTADYIFSDNDKIKTLYVTTSTSAITITLPTAADNLDRIIEVVKIDSGTGYVVVDGEGAETINGDTTRILRMQYDYIQIKCNGTDWYILKKRQTYNTGWVSLADWTDATETITHNLNKWLPDIKYRIYSSASGADGTDNHDITNITIFEGASAYGAVINSGANVNTVTFQTGAAGAIYIDSSGNMPSITVNNYYKIVLEVR